MSTTALSLLERFQYQQSIFVWSSRDLKAAHMLASSGLFTLEEGHAGGVAGHYLKMVKHW